MSEKNNIIGFPQKNRQTDNHPSHTFNRGDGKMPKSEKNKDGTNPVVKITLLNYDAGIQDTYSKNFMMPLLEGLLKRNQLANPNK